jgi:hypothetical protein
MRAAPELVGCWYALPWQDEPLFEECDEYQRGAQYMEVYWPPTRRLEIGEPLSINVEGLRTIHLRLNVYAWDRRYVILYHIEGDMRVTHAIALFTMALRLFEFVVLRGARARWRIPRLGFE